MSNRRLQAAAAAAAHARSNVLIAMLHRFSTQPSTPPLPHPEQFERDLRHLRGRGWRFASLREVSEALALSEDLPPTIVVTVDDGYRDFVELAVPALANVDCPATVFATSGFLDGTNWFWWDQLAYTLSRGPSTPTTVSIAGEDVVVAANGRTDSGVMIAERLKLIPDEQMRAAIRSLAEARGVELPTTAPEQYAPTSWADLRAVASSGFEVGPHTVSHPILAQVDDAQAMNELAVGWQRVEQEMGAAAVPIACYPNGKLDSFGDRDVALSMACGLTSGVSALPGTALRASAPGADMFRIPRIHWSPRIVQLAERPRLFGASLTTYMKVQSSYRKRRQVPIR